MRTEILKITSGQFGGQEALQRTLSPAVRLLRSGKLVAFPTETVYGLGAYALDTDSVHAIYQAKGRPSDNPLIVHIATFEQLAPLVREIPLIASELIKTFSPGPMTLILAKSEAVPAAVSGGLDTVAIRLPSHPVARALLLAVDIPIAAPSANRSGRPSPTCAAHVLRDLDGRIPMVIDGGDCDYGVESTVIDLCDPFQPRILRPGALTAEALAAYLDAQPWFKPRLQDWREKLGGKTPRVKTGEAPRAPGMKYRHYAPRTPVRIIRGISPEQKQQATLRLISSLPEGASVGLYLSDALAQRLRTALRDSIQTRLLWRVFSERDGGRSAARGLFSCLRDFDDKKPDLILVEALDETSLGTAFMNRLEKASGESNELPPALYASKTPD